MWNSEGLDAERVEEDVVNKYAPLCCPQVDSKCWWNHPTKLRRMCLMRLYCL